MVERIRHDAPVLVIGLGRFGAATAGQLQRLGREVLAVDEDANLVQKWSERVTHTVQADARNLGFMMVALGALLIVLLALVLLKPWRREQDAQLRQFQRFEQLLARQGIARYSGEGARDFAQRAAEQLPGIAAQIQRFSELYEQARYAGLFFTKCATVSPLPNRVVAL